MQRNSTIGELMERKRIQDGAKEYQGHTYMDLARFDEATKHMIIFDVLTNESPVGWKGERNRLYLSDVGYQKALDNQKAGNIKIISHAAVAKEDTDMKNEKWDDVHGNTTPDDRMVAFLESPTDSYAILQLREDVDDNIPLMFANYSYLQKKEMEPEIDRYEVVYHGSIGRLGSP